jgi:hypothetical protein
MLNHQSKHCTVIALHLSVPIPDATRTSSSGLCSRRGWLLSEGAAVALGTTAMEEAEIPQVAMKCNYNNVSSVSYYISSNEI